MELKPWGFSEVLSEGPDWRVKILHVNPGCRTSLQRHSGRRELMFVTHGHGWANRGGRTIELFPGKSLLVNQGEWHRLTAGGNVSLGLVEIWRGDDLREDDIERMEDDYGRA